MRNFPGSYLVFDTISGEPPPALYAPSIEAYVEWDNRRPRIDFLIDTGSEVTTLSLEDARAVLDTAWEEIDFDDPRTHVPLAGITGGIDAYPLELTLTFVDDVDAPERILTNVLIPRPAAPDADPVWDIPSLLGRDVLLQFGFHAIYEENSVYLTLPD